MRIALQKMSVAAAGLALSALVACTVGRVAYMQPAESDATPRGEKLAEYCFTAFPDSLDQGQSAFQNSTDKQTWENVNLTFQQNFLDGCYELSRLQGGDQ